MLLCPFEYESKPFFLYKKKKSEPEPREVTLKKGYSQKLPPQ